MNSIYNAIEEVFLVDPASRFPNKSFYLGSRHRFVIRQHVISQYA